MEKNEVRIAAVDIRSRGMRLRRYSGTHGVFTGLAKLGEPQPDDAEMMATLHAADGRGNQLLSLAIYRTNDNFFTTAPNSSDRCTIVRAELQSYAFNMEACEPCIAEVFAHLEEIASRTSEGGVTIKMALVLQCNGNPRLTFTIYRTYNDVILRVEQSKPRIAEA